MDNHLLTKEFPEFEKQIRHLKDSDSTFKGMYDHYEQVNSEIREYEDGNKGHTENEYLNNLRKRREQIKDEVYYYLKDN